MDPPQRSAPVASAVSEALGVASARPRHAAASSEAEASASSSTSNAWHSKQSRLPAAGGITPFAFRAATPFNPASTPSSSSQPRSPSLASPPRHTAVTIQQDTTPAPRIASGSRLPFVATALAARPMASFSRSGHGLATALRTPPLDTTSALPSPSSEPKDAGHSGVRRRKSSGDPTCLQQPPAVAAATTPAVAPLVVGGNRTSPVGKTTAALGTPLPQHAPASAPFMSSVFLRRKQQQQQYAAGKAPRPTNTNAATAAMAPVLFFQDTDSQTSSNGAAVAPPIPKTATTSTSSEGDSHERRRSSARHHRTAIEKLGELSREEDEYDFAILLKPVKYGDTTGLYVVNDDDDGDGDDDSAADAPGKTTGLRRRSTVLFGGASVADSSAATATATAVGHRTGGGGVVKMGGRELIVQRITRTGLVVKRLLSLDGRQTLLKVKAPQRVLEIGAERMKLRKLRRFDQIWMEFACELRETFADFDAALGGVRFIDSEKQSIVHMLLTTDVAAHGAGLNEFCPLKSKYVLKMFPLHKHRDLATLRRHWVAYWRYDAAQTETAMDATRGERRHAAAVHGRKSTQEEEDDDEEQEAEDTDAASSPEYIASCPQRMRRLVTHALSQPIDSVAQYYGERVAFYFAWTELYTRWLIVPSVAGVLLFMLQVQSKTLDHPLAAVYAVFMALWTSAFLLAWRRRAATLAYHWGTLGFEDAEITRPEFKGDPALSTGAVKRYPAWKRYAKYAVTIPSVATCIGAVMALTFLAFTTRDRLEQQSIAVRTRAKDVAHDIARDLERGLSLENLQRLTALGMSWDFWFYFLLTPVLYGLLIPALDLLFTRLARALTNWENHETETRHQSHLILKVFSFRFVHVFASLYYYAFARGSRDDSLLRVAVQLASFMVSDQLWRNAMQTLYPFVMRRCAARRKKRDANEQFQHSAVFHATETDPAIQHSKTDHGAVVRMQMMTQRNAVIHEQCVRLEQASDRAWEEAELEPYDTFEDYTEMLIQFGYVTFFSLAFPLAPLLALCNNVLELRMDAFKLCHAKQRPIARKASGIGVWLDVLQLMSVLAVLTNCLHIAFTTSLVERLVPAIAGSGASKVWVVFAVEHVLLALKAWMTVVVPAMPSAVKHSVRREREHAKLESARAMASKIQLQQQQQEQQRSASDSNDTVESSSSSTPTPTTTTTS